MLKYITHESICAFYLTMFSLMAPLTHTAEGGSSTMILMGGLLLCLAATVYVTHRNQTPIKYQFLITILSVVSVLFCFDYVIRPNKETSNYIYSFLIYGAFTIFFCAQVVDFRYFLKSYSILAAICGLVMASDPLFDYQWSNTYMEFGFVSMLPAFAGTMILFTAFKYKISGLLMCLFFVELMIFANKGSVLTALILFIIGFSFFRNGNKINLKQITTIVFVLLILYLYYADIFLFFVGIADNLGVDSYSLNTMKIILANSSDNAVYDSRIDIWNNALQYFYQNPIIGCGIGYYKSVSEGYEHNLILEVLNSWGIVGAILLLVILFKSVTRIVKRISFYQQTTIISFLIIAIFPLLTSMTFWAYQPFWAFITFSLVKSKKFYQ